MRRIIILFTLFLLAACKKETNLQNQNGNTNTLTVIQKTNEPKTVAPDTIFFSDDNFKKKDEFVLATLLDQKYQKDSLCIASFKLDFIKDRTLVYSHNIQIEGMDKGSVWSGNFELDSISSPLRKLSFGYGACGYMQYHYLFYINDKSADLVHQWESMSDSGWGTWGKIVSGVPQNFYFRTESFSPDDDNEEMGIAEYSDSTHFELKNNKWDRILLTKKDKIYRSKKVSFNQFHNIKD